MKTGRLGAILSSANQFVKVCTIDPTAKNSFINIRCLNQNILDAKVILAITESLGNPSLEDYIENSTINGKGGVVERTGVSVSAGESVWVFSDYDELVVRVDGFERD